MPKATVSYTDSRGGLHRTAESATVSDIAHLFGWCEGMATGIAHTVLKNRTELERIFAEFDESKGAVKPDA